MKLTIRRPRNGAIIPLLWTNLAMGATWHGQQTQSLILAVVCAASWLTLIWKTIQEPNEP